MPVYEYECEVCEHLFEVTRSMKEPSLTECPECGFDSLRQVLYPPTIHNPQTLGTIAERNTDRMGQYERQEKARDRHMVLPAGAESAKTPSTGKRPWWRPHRDKPDPKLAREATDAWKKHVKKEGS